MIYLTSYT